MFAQKVVEERDDAREEVERLRKDHEHNIDWYQQRFNRLRRWVKEEVEPLSADVARRYFAICANGSPSPHESADWRETMHGLSLERDAAREEVARLRAENERLRRASFVEAADTDARLIAAAPDLLDACVRLLDAVKRGDHKAKAIDAARAAVAKAMGGKP